MIGDDFIQHTSGRVLILGVHDGYVAHETAIRPAVSAVDIVEPDEKFCMWLRGRLWHGKFNLYHEDPEMWVPRQYYEYAWLDLWDVAQHVPQDEVDRYMRMFGQYCGEIDSRPAALRRKPI